MNWKRFNPSYTKPNSYLNTANIDKMKDFIIKFTNQQKIAGGKLENLVHWLTNFFNLEQINP